MIFVQDALLSNIYHGLECAAVDQERTGSCTTLSVVESIYIHGSEQDRSTGKAINPAYGT